MKNLIIEVSREGYTPKQIHGTMTVGELISLLEDFDEDMPVIVSHDNGYTYGGIRYDQFTETEDEDED